MLQERRKKISETCKKVGVGKWMLGRKLSEKTKRKISQKMKGTLGYWLGKKMLKEHRKNISNSLMGNQNAFGFRRSEETKRKISDATKGKRNHFWRGGKPQCSICNKIIEYRKKYCKKHRPITIETRKKLSEASLKGKKSPFWKGGITPINQKIRTSLEYKLWREAVFKRDNWTCVWCKQRGGKLNADHIKLFALFPALRFTTDNGRTLCKECHAWKTKWDMKIYLY